MTTNPFMQMPGDAERLAALSEGTCILCKPPSRLNDNRVCRAGVQWNIKTGEGHQYYPEPHLEPSTGLWQIISTDTTNYQVPQEAAKRMTEYYTRTEQYPSEELIHKWAKFAKLYGGRFDITSQQESSE